MAHIDQTSRRIVSAVAGFALAMTLMQVARARQRQRRGLTRRIDQMRRARCRSMSAVTSTLGGSTLRILLQNGSAVFASDHEVGRDGRQVADEVVGP